ncbi:hypothetical protein [Pseudarthrobacter sp. LMD1-1-1.1]|uniref:hypothetical protein n=1 Tax=Pseudarthrobacter sp. LMD1-1-1.1 TaxID=3135242 RepID=UPI003446D466
MALVMCPLNGSHEDVEVLEVLPDGRKRAWCPDCDYAWAQGAARPTPGPRSSQWPPRDLPTAENVTPEAKAAARRLQAEFLRQEDAGIDPRVPGFWSKYKRIFSEECLSTADPADLRAFGTDTSGSNLGDQRAFLRAFDKNPEYGAAQVRQVVNYLLRGTDKPLEDRLTDIINDRVSFSFPGFKEVLLSKVLSVAYQERFLTLLTYKHKSMAARALFGLDLPPQSQSLIGQQIVWSNDLLMGLVGDRFMHGPHAGEFLWWTLRQAANKRQLPQQ